jgi:hypothetical protein
MLDNKRPIEAKYSKSSLLHILSDKDYLNYCCDSEPIQDYWRSPEYMVYPMNEAMQQPIPVVASNINPGDFFNLGNSKKAQIAMVTEKQTVCQSALKEQSWKPSAHKPGGDYLRYHIQGDRGGFFYEQPHKEMISGFFQWLPLPCQLIAIGMITEAQELQEIMLAVASIK